ncbi:glycosyltransferase family protein [Flavobacterium piscinae]|uniref:hypothetical protein n=1 Tax=Flavobacterium piscinae TaxID=2506424 RepID=UPI002AAB3BD9|nr:hypothetical protein [Flavobacterium piscinae]
MKKKIIRTSTIALSLDVLLKGQLSFLNKTYDVIAISGEDEHLTTVRQRENIRTVSVSIQRQISPLKDIVSLYHLYRVFKKKSLI